MSKKLQISRPMMIYLAGLHVRELKKGLSILIGCVPASLQLRKGETAKSCELLADFGIFSFFLTLPRQVRYIAKTYVK
jgi:hypothetical protein